MVKENTVAGIDSVSFPVIDGNPVRIQFSYGIRGAGIEGGAFPLRGFSNQTVQFRGRSLVKFCLVGHAQDPDRFQKPQGAKGISVGGIFRFFERDCDVGLGCQAALSR